VYHSEESKKEESLDTTCKAFAAGAFITLGLLPVIAACARYDIENMIFAYAFVGDLIAMFIFGVLVVITSGNVGIVD